MLTKAISDQIISNDSGVGVDTLLHSSIVI